MNQMTSGEGISTEQLARELFEAPFRMAGVNPKDAWKHTTNYDQRKHIRMAAWLMKRFPQIAPAPSEERK